MHRSTAKKYQTIQCRIEGEVKAWNLLSNNWDKLTDIEAKKLMDDLKLHNEAMATLIPDRDFVKRKITTESYIKSDIRTIISSLICHDKVKKLDSLINDDENVSIRIRILTEVFPQVVLFKKFEIANEKQKFELLNEYFKNNSIDPENQMMLVNEPVIKIV